MAEVTLYKNDGSTSGVLALPDALFDVQIKPDVVHEAIIAQLANHRDRIASTKDRSEVAGTGKKPWKQKGTGRARHGSRRSPIWVGGGITFGPTRNRLFGKKINKKVKRLALAMMLTDKVRSNQFVAVEAFGLADAKTKFIAELRAKLPGSDRTALIVTTKEDIDVVRATRNLPNTVTVSAQSLNVRDLAQYTFVIASKDAIERMKETYLA